MGLQLGIYLSIIKCNLEIHCITDLLTASHKHITIHYCEMQGLILKQRCFEKSASQQISRRQVQLTCVDVAFRCTIPEE